MAYDYSGGGYDYQAEQERLRMEQEAIRQQQEAEAQRIQQMQEQQAQQEQARQATEGRTLGDLMAPQAPANPYEGLRTAPGQPPGPQGQPGAVAPPGAAMPAPGPGDLRTQPMPANGVGALQLEGQPPQAPGAPNLDAIKAQTRTDPGIAGQTAQQAPQDAAQDAAPAGHGYQHDPARDYSAQPLTGAELEAFGGNPYVQGATTYYGGTALPQGQKVPGRDATDMSVDQFNQGIRGSELYQQFIHGRGLQQPDGKTREWTDADRNAWRRTLEASGVRIPDGMKIDNAGNLNEINKTGKRVAITAAIVAGAVLTAGAAGAFAGGAAAAGGAGGAAAGGATAAGVGTGAAVAGGATAAGVGAGAAAGAAGAAGAGMGAAWVPSVVQGIAGVGSAYMGARAQSQATRAAADAQREGSASSERMLTAQMQADREAREQDRADAERRWNAEQEFARKQWDAQEEERMYQRKIYEEDRAAALNRGGGGYSGPSLPDPKQLRREQAQRTLAALLAQGTPGANSVYTPATSAGPVGRG